MRVCFAVLTRSGASNIDAQAMSSVPAAIQNTLSKTCRVRCGKWEDGKRARSGHLAWVSGVRQGANDERSTSLPKKLSVYYNTS